LKGMSSHIQIKGKKSPLTKRGNIGVSFSVTKGKGRPEGEGSTLLPEGA